MKILLINFYQYLYLLFINYIYIYITSCFIIVLRMTFRQWLNLNNRYKKKEKSTRTYKHKRKRNVQRKRFHHANVVQCQQLIMISHRRITFLYVDAILKACYFYPLHEFLSCRSVRID